ncbi:MAG: aldehyde dehydrogenase family protein [Sporocytophaga sp.]|uniref:aldehyde dehydrogenase family protein n=1 Tax=Sporocytophaga sp. TaxID=2231183 RepID=UPI001B05C669|nr:aldehyde dehydrogenase family protein [Sporocytophaga sp.]MBO9699921.1 aldehyde dehydrogenase family protein [Sporocytophaga sp.]
MTKVDMNYINGKFVSSFGSDLMKIINPATGQQIGEAILGNEQDLLDAIHAAKKAFTTFSLSSVEDRKLYLQQLHDAVIERLDDLKEVTISEYGATVQRAEWSNRYAADIFLQFKNLLDDFNFVRSIGKSQLILTPIGVTAIMTAWNANSGSICIKLAAAIAAGCTTVIKPSEMSCLQTQVLMEAFDNAGLPAGVINVVNGRGDVMGTLLANHSDIAKICFTGSTVVGKIIARSAVDTMKRLTLELSGKSPHIILDDADLEKTIPFAVNACFQNSGQACVAGSRLLVPKHLMGKVRPILQETVKNLKVGLPNDPDTKIGPMASQKQYDRIQYYIRSGIESGAELLVGGEGRPEGLENGYFVKPTLFINVTSDMKIAREEVFGPVLSVLTYETEEDAIAMANDTEYGLQAYISSSNSERANRIAKQINAGRVLINTLWHDSEAPFGGFKQSGLGREGGIFGLEAQLEPKVIIS